MIHQATHQLRLLLISEAAPDGNRRWTSVLQVRHIIRSSRLPRPLPDLCAHVGHHRAGQTSVRTGMPALFGHQLVTEAIAQWLSDNGSQL